MAQALISFLKNQYVERDGKETKFFAGVWGIFGHGNLAGVGQALQENPDFPYYLTRNEQSMVHIASGFAKASNRLRAFACTTSVGPGATNMVTGAALATINRLPVLLLPGDIFAKRVVAPVLQQLEQPYSQDISVNDCFKPVSRYWDRINRADQLPFALLETMRVLTSPSETGAVTLSLPQDTQTEAYDYPVELFNKRVWHIVRAEPEAEMLKRATQLIQKAKKPLIICGGGVHYSDACDALKKFAEKTGIPVCETQAGKGALVWNHAQNLGAVGATGGAAANLTAKEADVVVAIGTRLSDFTTASKTAFQSPRVKFISVNVCEMDAYKHAALPLVADAKKTLLVLAKALSRYHVSSAYKNTVEKRRVAWNREVDKLYAKRGQPMIQSQALGILNNFIAPKDVVVCAAGSLPGDLHKLWRTRDTKGYHLEYGYSCMGYEIAGGLGVKMADASREVYVMVGDGSYLMLSAEIVTSIQENMKLTIILLNNHGYASIGGLSESLGSEGFGTRYRFRNKKTGQLDGGLLPVDFVENARSMGAATFHAANHKELVHALEEARKQRKTSVIVVDVERSVRAPGYHSWWDVSVAEVSTMPSVKKARKNYEKNVKKERMFL